MVANYPALINVVERRHRAGITPDVKVRAQELWPGPMNLRQLTLPGSELPHQTFLRCDGGERVSSAPRTRHISRASARRPVKPPS